MIYVLLAAYNEGDGIEVLLRKIGQVLEKNYQIVLVNDGSSDNTKNIAEKMASELPIKVVNHPQNSGLGEAIKTGLNEIVHKMQVDDIMVALDADNTHPPELILVMQEKIHEGADVVIASRFCRGGKEIGVSVLRKILSRGAKMFLQALFSFSGVNDYTCGFRAYRGSLLKKAYEHYQTHLVTESGFVSTVELLLKLKRFNPKVVEIPLVLRYDLKSGKSKIKIWRTILRYFQLLNKFK